MIVIDPHLYRKGLRPCVTISFNNTVGVMWPHMQSYVYYSIIIDCVYYDVGNEASTEIIIVIYIYSVQGRSANTEVETCCLSERERATLFNEP